ncbi:molecular chaperone HtpG [candidate division FCPU426 bacterium]|nr:molecular chaperone HtpG [candidate division FCPU426 bacterium]
MPEQTIEKREFKTEVNQLLDLVVHSLYSHKDIFLRELISNASDAIDRIRYQALLNSALLEENPVWQIAISIDQAASTLTISDNGIGMTHDELIHHLGTIAKSGTKEFLATLQQNQENINLIGQFGVGFYSSFMVADKVEVVSKPASGDAHRWVSDGKQGFEIGPAARAGRGTDIVLQLKEECKNYLEEHEIRSLVKKYSDFVEFPIVMEVEREELPRDKDGKPLENATPEKKRVTETLNSMKAIWTKSKKDVAADEYNEFYRHLTHEYADPLDVIHYHAEGTIEFKTLIYIPSQPPFDLMLHESQKGLQLYINRVFIMSDAKNLVPPYLRFLKGVVDTNDLPLNVSREILQQDAQLDKIRKNIVHKILAHLKEMMEKDYEKYLKFYQAFGTVLKEGLHYDYEQREAIAGLLLFESTKTKQGEYRSLGQYLADMPAGQKSIYYHTAEDRLTALGSPYLEAFRAKNWEVLLMLEAIDEIVLPDLYEFKQKPLKAVSKGELDFSEDGKQENEEKHKKDAETYKDLLSLIQAKLTDEVKEVRFSKRLTDSPACLVLDETGMSRHMQSLFKAMGKEMPPQKNILEMNPRHALIGHLDKLRQENPHSAVLDDYVALLYDQALLSAGFKVKDPASFSQRLTQLMLARQADSSAA